MLFQKFWFHHRLKFAGANNPLWVISKAENYKEFVEAVGQRASYTDAENDENIRLVEIKGDKQPIGAFDDSRPFETVSMKLEEGDIVYVFSDGFADQFGGASGKKYMIGRFKSLLTKLSIQSFKNQHDELEKELNEWQGDQERIDDVLVIGFMV